MPQVVRRRVLAAEPGGMDKLVNESTPVFAQVTARITTDQVFAAYGSSGQLLRGDPDKASRVVDYWVFEKILAKSAEGSRWRLLKRLAIDAA